ncbi:MAG: hypothetical protein AB1445_15680 [Bacillota bacterium]
MSREERLGYIREIQRLRRCPLLVYLTGDRPYLETKIDDDALRVLYDHLELTGRPEALDLFLYTRGGNTLTPPRLVSLIREYTSELRVLVPYRCHSAGTLICLGANSIVMTRMGELSPIDPATANEFNPPSPDGSGARLPVSVEDVTAYFRLAQQKAGVTGPELVRVFEILAERVHPLALGNVQRTHALIRLLAERMLSLHLAGEDRAGRIKHIVDSLTEKLYAHRLFLGRREATELGLNVVRPEPELEAAIWGLYTVYERDLQLDESFRPERLAGQTQVRFSELGAVVESVPALHGFMFEGTVLPAPAGGEPRLVPAGHRWRRLE